MAVNKVVFGGQTLVDLTADTVTPQTLMEGVTAHDRSGAVIVGTATGGGAYKVYDGTVVAVIRFTIGADAYQAEEGMTWAEWCESDYNPGGEYLVEGTGVYADEGRAYLAYGNRGVRPSDTIIHGGGYNAFAIGGGAN